MRNIFIFSLAYSGKEHVYTQYDLSKLNEIFKLYPDNISSIKYFTYSKQDVYCLVVHSDYDIKPQAAEEHLMEMYFMISWHGNGLQWTTNIRSDFQFTIKSSVCVIDDGPVGFVCFAMDPNCPPWFTWL